MGPDASIIGTSSVNSDSPTPALLPYDVTKAGIANMTAALAQLLAPRGGSAGQPFSAELRSRRLGTCHRVAADRDNRVACQTGLAMRGGKRMPRAQIKDEKTYRALRREGNSEEKSARIANAAAGSSRKSVGRRGGQSGSYEEWSKKDLLQRAREIGVKGRSSMSKAQLVSALRGH